MNEMVHPVHQCHFAATNKSSASTSSSFSGKEEEQNQSEFITTIKEQIDNSGIAPISSDARRPGGTFVMKYLVPTLLVLVATKYQGQPDDLFSKNAVQLWTVVVSTCIYCAILEIFKDSASLYQRYYEVFDFIASTCMLFSVTSLVTLLLSSDRSLPVFIVSTSLIAFVQAARLIYARFKTKLMSITTQLWAKLSTAATHIYTKLCGRLPSATPNNMEPI